MLVYLNDRISCHKHEKQVLSTVVEEEVVIWLELLPKKNERTRQSSVDSHFVGGPREFKDGICFTSS
jgi:hypothetical protein